MTLRPRSIAGVFAALAVFIMVHPVAAQVIEVGAGGAVVVHNGPEVTSSAGSAPITVSSVHRAQAGRPNAARARVAPAELDRAAAGAQLSADLVEAVAWRESRLSHGLVSTKGAIGAMQLMPGTARSLGVDPFNGAQNLNGGAAYLRALLRRYDGDVVKTLAAYNAGPAAVDRYNGVPPFKETRIYIADILDHMSERAVSAAVKR